MDSIIKIQDLLTYKARETFLVPKLRDMKLEAHGS